MIKLSLFLSLFLVSCTKDEGMTVEKMKDFLGKHSELQSQIGNCDEAAKASNNTMQFEENEVRLNIKGANCTSTLKMKYQLHEPNIMTMTKASVVNDGCNSLSNISAAYSNTYSIQIEENNLKMTHLQSGECKILKGI